MSKEILAFLAEVAEGDMGALSGLYDLLAVRIFNYARTITRNKELAEDITHDIFMLIVDQAARIAKMSNPFAYVMVAVRHQSYDHLKRANRTTVLDDTAEVSAEFPSYDSLLIEEALFSLPANQRETIYLYHICGYSQKEVAGIMSVPLVTVKWRSGKALSALRAYFNQDKEEPSNGTLLQ
ncbi:MAG: RNA polymerase sigma factor [Oscillospiraceae bacterium]|nr:RNA polymerase sigma factor [Oscillospiraceae bacterium]